MTATSLRDDLVSMFLWDGPRANSVFSLVPTSTIASSSSAQLLRQGVAFNPFEGRSRRGCAHPAFV
jgi:hypothetical protein